MAQIDIKEIQRKAYTSYHQDGLLDIFASAYIVTFSVGILMEYLYDFSMGTILPVFIIPIIIPLWVAAKRKITMPRIGYVNFGQRAKPKLLALFGGVAGLGFAFLFVFAFSKSSPWFTFVAQNSMLLLGVAVLLVVSLAAYAMGIKRFYAYGVLSFALLVAGHFLEIFFAYITLVLSITVMATGFALLARFIRKYPIKGD